MAITGAGFDGTLTEADWARIAGPWGIPDQTVAGSSTTDFLVTKSGSTLSATVAAGTYNRHGILAKSTATETVTFTNPASGSRYDAVCLLIDWTTNTISLQVIQGSATEQIPWAGMQQTIGTKMHVPIALVKLTAGNASPVSVRDIREGIWVTATLGENFTHVPGSDKIMVLREGDRWMIRGTVQWTSSPVDGTDIITLPVARSPIGIHQIGMATAESGGITALMLAPSWGGVGVAAQRMGTWTVGTNVRVFGTAVL